MDANEEAFTRKRVCYEQNFQQARSLNEQMNRVPTLAVTLTGGLWYGASAVNAVDISIRFGLLILAGLCNAALILASIRIRDVLESYFERLKAFDPESYASGRPSSPKLGRLRGYSMIGVYTSLMGIGAVLSFAGAFGWYWPFTFHRRWGLLVLLVVLGGVFYVLNQRDRSTSH